ncbi:hypothetical protein OKA06_10630 [Novosphingobium sp. MW5]|nr:hypothetical protein [Novosphingobium sp. MW5]
MSRAPPLAPGLGQLDVGRIGHQHAVHDAALHHVAFARRLGADRVGYAGQVIALVVDHRAVRRVGIDHFDIWVVLKAVHSAQQDHLGPFAGIEELLHAHLVVTASPVLGAPFGLAAQHPVFLVVDARIARGRGEVFMPASVVAAALIEVEAPGDLALHRAQFGPVKHVRLRAEVGAVLAEGSGLPQAGELLFVFLPQQAFALRSVERGDIGFAQLGGWAIRAGILAFDQW